MINPIKENRTAAVDTNGVLSGWIQQPTDSAPAEARRGEPTYTEQYKGPYSLGKEILSKIRAGDTLDYVHTHIGGIQSEYTAPTCPNVDGKKAGWIVESIGVQELEAGDHCILDVKYSASIVGYDIQSLVESAEKDTWNCTWQSYTVSPFAFCSNTEHIDTVVSPGANGTDYSPDWSLPAQRSHIEGFRNLVENKFHAINGAYIYKEGDQRYYLNPTEVQIQKKIDLGKSAVYHYPVLTHTTEKTGRWDGGGSVIDYDADIGQEIDYQLKDNALSSCPFSFDTTSIDNEPWKWIKVGDDITQIKDRNGGRVVYTRKETFWGFKSLDQNFYGRVQFSHDEQGILSGRWKIGEL